MQTSKGNSQKFSRGLSPNSATPPLEITRKFSTPVNQLFASFGDAEILKKWWWPNGLYADQVDLDFREGGNYFFNMKGFGKDDGGMTGTFSEIVPNEKIVMTDFFADGEGAKITAQEAGLNGEWPEEILIELTFEKLGNDESCLHLVQTGIPVESQKECTQGWRQSFDKLEKLLRSA